MTSRAEDIETGHFAFDITGASPELGLSWVLSGGLVGANRKAVMPIFIHHWRPSALPVALSGETPAVTHSKADPDNVSAPSVSL